MNYEAPAEAAAQVERDIVFGEKTLIQIGRDPGNDVVLPSPSVSRFHAQIQRVGQRYRAEDLDLLLVGDFQGASRNVARNLETHLGNESPVPAAETAAIDDSEAAALDPEEDVLGDRAMRQECEILRDHRDAVPESVVGRPVVDRPPLDEEVARVGLVHAGDDLAQRHSFGGGRPGVEALE